MIEDLYFQDEGSVRITAASVGISRLRWTSASEEDVKLGNYISIMSRNRFDHLPIEPSNGVIKEYFKTIKPNNYDSIQRCKIQYSDVINIDTNIRDIIERFATEQRTFFFIKYQKNISGLITIGNLNCKQVQVYIFSLICELERELGHVLNSQLTTEAIKSWIETKAEDNKENDKYRKILASYNDLTKLDLENQLTEHLFFVDFFSIIEDNELYKEIDFSKKEWQKLSGINELRKRIAHPTRSLIDKDNDISKLQERLHKIDDLIYRLTINRKCK